MDFHLDLPLNYNEPSAMHIDINSFFASVEQQANPLLRGRPIAVAAYATSNGCILSPSVEAKRLGIKTGMSVREGRLLSQDLVVLTQDATKYRDVHAKLMQLFSEYTSRVKPRSIDEAVLDFSHINPREKELEDIAKEIKRRIRAEIGDWLLCSIGIGTNRFLAKTAAGMRKPDGLTVVTARNLLQVYSMLGLTDLPGINKRYEARLNAAGIFTTLEFLYAPLNKLRDQVFKSVNGYHWYLRLRGWEPDAIDFNRRSFGQVYTLPRATTDTYELSRIIMKLCEKMGRRLRRSGNVAHAIHVAVVYRDRMHWHRGMSVKNSLYTTQELYRHTLLVLNHQPERKPIARIGVSCSSLEPQTATQLDLFDDNRVRDLAVTRAADEINDRYGEFVITPALMLGLHDKVTDVIGFGGVGEISAPTDETL